MDVLDRLYNLPAYQNVYFPVPATYEGLGYRGAVLQAAHAEKTGLELRQETEQGAEENRAQILEENRKRQARNVVYYSELDDERQTQIELLHTQQAMQRLYPNYTDSDLYWAQAIWLIDSV